MGLFDRLFGKKATRIEASPPPAAAPQPQPQAAQPAPQPAPPPAAPSPQDAAREAEGVRMMTELLDEVVRNVATALAARGQVGGANFVYVIAAVAGQMAQAGAIRARARAGEPLEAPHVAAVETASGRTYLFGDAIGAALIGVANDPGVLWQSAGTAGLPFDQEVINELFRHAAATVGSDDFGRPRGETAVSPDLNIDQAVLHIQTVVPSFTKRGIGQDIWPRMTALATRHALLAAARDGDMAVLGQIALDAAIAGARVQFEDVAARK
ncbi:hypothetical protein SAMN06295912_105139 [Sphingomonas laterariae]|uniref:Uncharacterized protein n=1 Tax=Edaphosphingomonas laterariae TaxID=861865 RepID=A0A239E1X7_9SPHN|nr:hypothetical protein [Sphingomonas laterariae]SNS37993.1 hypothetical protein SAMN06295912_105139 [Sphingomonas laterariae]